MSTRTPLTGDIRHRVNKLDDILAAVAAGDTAVEGDGWCTIFGTIFMGHAKDENTTDFLMTQMTDDELRSRHLITIEEYLSLCHSHGLAVLLELKAANLPNMVRLVHRMAALYQDRPELFEKVEFHSFSILGLTLSQALMPEVPRHLLWPSSIERADEMVITREGKLWTIGDVTNIPDQVPVERWMAIGVGVAKALGCVSFNPFHVTVNHFLMTHIRVPGGGGLRILPYGVNTEEQAQKMRDLGVNGIIHELPRD